MQTITEDLGESGRLAEEQLEEMGGVPDFRYELATVFSEDEVGEILNEEPKQDWRAGAMKAGRQVEHHRRKNSICSPKGIIFERALLKLYYAFQDANARLWGGRNHRIASLSCSWNSYGPGHFLTWHYDNEEKDLIAIIACLANAQRGGMFQLNGVGDVPLKPGQAIIFPGRVLHRISPVLKGRRDSLAIWVAMEGAV